MIIHGIYETSSSFLVGWPIGLLYLFGDGTMRGREGRGLIYVFQGFVANIGGIWVLAGGGVLAAG